MRLQNRHIRVIWRSLLVYCVWVGLEVNAQIVLVDPDTGVEFELTGPAGTHRLLLPERSVSLKPISPSPPFRPPSLFSAPLPAGSGARALGFSGSFSAIADDATAASWNPAGLTQLERPEASAVYRFSHTRNEHHSDTEGFAVDEDNYQSDGVNYLTLAYPFFFEPTGNNMVFSLNHQEAYDFEHQFHARIADRSTSRFSSFRQDAFAPISFTTITSSPEIRAPTAPSLAALTRLPTMWFA